MTVRWPALAISALLFAAFAMHFEGQAGPVVQVDYSNPGLTPAHWTLILRPDGNGHFRSERGNVTPQASDSSQLDAPEQDRDIHMSAQFTSRVFQAAHNHRWFNVECESHFKMAFQGLKKLSYTGPEGQGSCEFNYSKDKDIQALGDSMVAVADTILEGARLELFLHHDRLGLDKEMEYLTEAQGDGRVQEIYVIRGILTQLADDPGVMERVRKRARFLLGRMEE